MCCQKVLNDNVELKVKINEMELEILSLKNKSHSKRTNSSNGNANNTKKLKEKHDDNDNIQDGRMMKSITSSDVNDNDNHHDNQSKQSENTKINVAIQGNDKMRILHDDRDEGQYNDDVVDAEDDSQQTIGKTKVKVTKHSLYLINIHKLHHSLTIFL